LLTRSSNERGASTGNGISSSTEARAVLLGLFASSWIHWLNPSSLSSLESVVLGGGVAGTGGGVGGTGGGDVDGS
jgi:hypothetical protein